MILNRPRACFGLSIVCLIALLAGCSGHNQDSSPQRTTVDIVRPKAGDNEGALQKEPVAVPPNANAIETALNKLFETGNDPAKPSAIPKGVKLNQFTLADGIARVNVSKEWND